MKTANHSGFVLCIVFTFVSLFVSCLLLFASLFVFVHFLIWVSRWVSLLTRIPEYSSRGSSCSLFLHKRPPFLDPKIDIIPNPLLNVGLDVIRKPSGLYFP